MSCGKDYNNVHLMFFCVNKKSSLDNKRKFISDNSNRQCLCFGISTILQLVPLGNALSTPVDTLPSGGAGLWTAFHSHVPCVLTYVCSTFPACDFPDGCPNPGARPPCRPRPLQNTAGGKNCLWFSLVLPFSDANSLVFPVLGMKTWIPLTKINISLPSLNPLQFA